MSENEKASGAGSAPEAKLHDDDGIIRPQYIIANGGRRQAESSAEELFNESIRFLKQLRPNGPWVLTAITPDGPTNTITARTAVEVDAFVSEHNGKRNIYYSVNPTRTALIKKAAKTDIAAIEYLLGDLDPNASESSADAKTRYLQQLETFEPKPTAVVDFGNGIQCLWQLENRIVLGAPLKADGKLAFSPEDQAKIKDAEDRTAAIMVRLGAKPGTQNIDRILRLPGTINLPNAKKLKDGRKPCPTRVIEFNGARYSLNSFPLPEKQEQNKPGTPEDGGHHERQQGGDEDELWQTINADFPVGQRSEKLWWVINEMFRRGYRVEVVLATILDRRNKISAHIYEHEGRLPREYAERQIAEARSKVRLTESNGEILKTPSNICVALLKLGITLRYDRFADRMLINGLPDFGPVLEDAALDRLWLILDRQFRFRPTKDLLRTVVSDVARLNGFHPVRDYLDNLHWDGVKRIDGWLIDYGGAEDTEYSRAVSALMLVAAVRRVRSPGCKFDEMVVIENEDQGTDKSTMLATLAVRDDWFSDDLPLNISGKQVVESLRGRWIIEAAELSGMRRADVEHLKAFLSRQIDRARMAYGHFVTEVPRQCIIVGTTNAVEYLKDTSGNRRFWPVRVKKFDIAALRRHRDQLWAEAAQREAGNASIRLDPKLWRSAEEEQEQRLTRDPWYDALQSALGEMKGKITSISLWEILDVRGGQRTQEQSRRLGDAMRQLGWRRANKARTIKVEGRDVMGFVCGEQPWRLISVMRNKNGELLVHYDDVMG